MTDPQPDRPDFLPPDFPDRAAFEREWVAALRSGEYVQGKDWLRPTETTWCCLGVACDVAVKHGVGRWDGHDRMSYVSRDDPKASVLPVWLAVYLHRGDLGGRKGTEECLSGLNDDGVSFDVIAGVIEGSIAYEDAAKAVGR